MARNYDYNGDPCGEYGSAVRDVERLRKELARLRLTDEERADLQMWEAECLRQCSGATDGGDLDAAERWSGRAARAVGLLERLK
jgi:hypothetical protein